MRLLHLLTWMTGHSEVNYRYRTLALKFRLLSIQSTFLCVCSNEPVNREWGDGMTSKGGFGLGCRPPNEDGLFFSYLLSRQFSQGRREGRHENAPPGSREKNEDERGRGKGKREKKKKEGRKGRKAGRGRKREGKNAGLGMVTSSALSHLQVNSSRLSSSCA